MEQALAGDIEIMVHDIFGPTTPVVPLSLPLQFFEYKALLS